MDRPTLPRDRNPMLAEGRSPGHEILVERRCLGQTELKVKPGQVGTSNATKAKNLGTLDYAHLRVPLPKDLAGSEIFAKTGGKWPEAYFLMRRSSDGFISATGMFKAAFPYAQVDEETAEKDYIKSLSEASSEEIAGNVWIDPGKALELAEEYGISLWIAALLDPEPITHGTNDPKKLIKSPPPYKMKETANGIGRTPDKGTATKRSTRGTRSMRSESPTSTRPKATPRSRKTAGKTPRKGRGEELASVDENASVQDEPVNGEKADTVTVEVENKLVPDANGEETTESTKVNVTMPSDHPDLHLDNPKKAMEVARQMTEQAKKMGEPSGASRKSKRKAQDMVEADDEVGLDGPASRAAKKVKPVEVQLRKERMRTRALTGIAASVAIGALVPSIASFLGFLS